MNPDLIRRVIILKFIHIKTRLHDGRTLTVLDWQPKLSEYWAITGTNGSGKTALSLLPANKIVIRSTSSDAHNTIENIPKTVSYLSLEAQEEYLENERKLDESDITNEHDPGTLICDFLAPLDAIDNEIDRLRIRHILNQGLRTLSTGESRKVLLLKALQDSPDLLVLDAPLEGLDTDSRIVFNEILNKLHQQHQPMLWVANRLDEMPEWITHIAFMHDAELIAQGTKASVLTLPEIQGLMHFDSPLINFPSIKSTGLSLEEGDSLIQLKDVYIRYGELTLFDHLDWSIQSGSTGRSKAPMAVEKPVYCS